MPRVTKALLDFQCLRGLSSSSLEVRPAKHSVSTSRVASGVRGGFGPTKNGYCRHFGEPGYVMLEGAEVDGGVQVGVLFKVSQHFFGDERMDSLQDPKCPLSRWW